MVERIEQIQAEVVTKTAEPQKTDGLYYCYSDGQTKYPITFNNLDDAATFLVENKRSRIRMNPDWSIMVDDIHIDGVAREELP